MFFWAFRIVYFWWEGVAKHSKTQLFHETSIKFENISWSVCLEWLSGHRRSPKNLSETMGFWKPHCFWMSIWGHWGLWGSFLKPLGGPGTHFDFLTFFFKNLKAQGDFWKKCIISSSCFFDALLDGNTVFQEPKSVHLGPSETVKFNETSIDFCIFSSFATCKN